MSRAEALQQLMRAVDDIEDREVHGLNDERHIAVVELFRAIDWNAVPHDLIRDLFRLVVERAPLEGLPDLVTQATSEVESNQQIRAEMAFQRLTGRKLPIRMEAN